MAFIEDEPNASRQHPHGRTISILLLLLRATLYIMVVIKRWMARQFNGMKDEGQTEASEPFMGFRLATK